MVHYAVVPSTNRVCKAKKIRDGTAAVLLQLKEGMEELPPSRLLEETDYGTLDVTFRVAGTHLNKYCFYCKSTTHRRPQCTKCKGR